MLVWAAFRSWLVIKLNLKGKCRDNMIPTQHCTLLRKLMTTTAVLVLLQFAAVRNVEAELHVESQSSPAGTTALIVDGTATIFDDVQPNAGLVVVQPMGRTQVYFKEVDDANREITFRGGTAPGLTINQSFRTIHPRLIERTVTVTAESDQRYFLDLGWNVVGTGAFYSFLGEEPRTKRYSPGCGGPEFKEQSSQTFPLVGYRQGDMFYGIIGDTPGLWENRSFLQFDVVRRALSVATGDGSPKRVISIPRELGNPLGNGQWQGLQPVGSGSDSSKHIISASSPESPADRKRLYLYLGCRLRLEAVGQRRLLDELRSGSSRIRRSRAGRHVFRAAQLRRQLLPRSDSNLLDK